MLQLSTLTFYSVLHYTYLQLYVFFTHFRLYILFYPLGIILTLYVLVCIFYTIFKSVRMLRKLVKFCEFNNIGFFELLDRIIRWLPYYFYPWIRLYLIFIDLIKHYAMYIFVFYLKRVEFYVFCFVVIAYYY